MNYLKTIPSALSLTLLILLAEIALYSIPNVPMIALLCVFIVVLTAIFRQQHIPLLFYSIVPLICSFISLLVSVRFPETAALMLPFGILLFSLLFVLLMHPSITAALSSLRPLPTLMAFLIGPTFGFLFYSVFLLTKQPHFRDFPIPLAAVIGIALAEELYYRYVLIKLYNKLTPIFLSIIISALFYAGLYIGHGWQVFLTAYAFGIIMGLITLHKSSLMYPLIINITGKFTFLFFVTGILYPSYFILTPIVGK